MNQIELEKELNELWYGIIEQMNFDVLAHKITFDIKVIVSNEIVKKYQIVFSDVSSFFFIENIGSRGFNQAYEMGDYLEFTTIDYYKNGIGKIIINSSREDWTKQWSSSANFAIEIWSSILFIEAKVISINDKIFEVGYPTLD